MAATKKLLIILLLFAIFLKLVHHYNNKWSEDFFGDFYTYEYIDTKDKKPSSWEKFKAYVKELYDKTLAEDEERFIYK